MFGLEPVTNDSDGTEKSSQESSSGNIRSDGMPSKEIEGLEDSSDSNIRRMDPPVRVVEGSYEEHDADGDKALLCDAAPDAE